MLDLVVYSHNRRSNTCNRSTIILVTHNSRATLSSNKISSSGRICILTNRYSSSNNSSSNNSSSNNSSSNNSSISSNSPVTKVSSK
jgi:hypothetical protein